MMKIWRRALLRLRFASWKCPKLPIRLTGWHPFAKAETCKLKQPRDTFNAYAEAWDPSCKYWYSGPTTLCYSTGDAKVWQLFQWKSQFCGRQTSNVCRCKFTKHCSALVLILLYWSKLNFPAYLFAHLMQLQKVQQVIQVAFQEYADFMHILISKSNLHFFQS